jgi:hypothetical protein
MEDHGRKGAPLLGTFRGRRDFILTGGIVHWDSSTYIKEGSGNGIAVHGTPRWGASNSGGERLTPVELCGENLEVRLFNSEP